DSLVEVYVILIVAWRWRREGASNRWVSRTHLKRCYGVTERALEFEIRHVIRSSIKCTGRDVHRLHTLRDHRRAVEVEGDPRVAPAEERLRPRANRQATKSHRCRWTCATTSGSRERPGCRQCR